MFFISRKRFEEEVKLRVRDEVDRIEEYRWRDDFEREYHREMSEMSNRLRTIEQALSVEVPEEMGRIGF